MKAIEQKELWDDLKQYYQQRLDGILYWNRVSHAWNLYDTHKQCRTETAHKIIEFRRKLRAAKNQGNA